MKIQMIAKDGDENVTKWYLHTSATMLNGKMVLARFSVHICGKEQVLKLSSHCFCVISHMWALFIPMTLITLSFIFLIPFFVISFQRAFKWYTVFPKDVKVYYTFFCTLFSHNSLLWLFHINYCIFTPLRWMYFYHQGMM